MRSIDNYTALIIAEHSDKPKFVATVSALAQGFVDNSILMDAMVGKFNLDTAVGQQLDAIGLWLGFQRGVSSPLSGVYFAFDISGVGFDEGVWKGPFDPAAGVISLDDDTYRFMLRIRIAANSWDGSLAGAQAILTLILSASPETYMFLQDNFDMSMLVGVVGPTPNVLVKALLTAGYVFIRPSGVRISSVVFSPAPIFGFDNNSFLISGFDIGIWS